MKLLAWDTSSKSGVIVALEWGGEPPCKQSHYDFFLQNIKLLAEFTINVDAAHSEQLLWGIHQVLESLHWKLKEIDLIGIGIGPGSFTGLRIGITTARTLAHTLNIPLLRVSSLVALAHPVGQCFLHKGFEKNVLIVVSTEACKDELFALWGDPLQISQSVIAPHVWAKDVKEEVIGAEVLVKNLKEQLVERRDGFKQYVLVGTGHRRYLDVFKQLPKAQQLECPFLFSHQIQGRTLGYLAWRAYQEKEICSALAVYPAYFRVTEAELKQKKIYTPKFLDSYKKK